MLLSFAFSQYVCIYLQCRQQWPTIHKRRACVGYQREKEESCRRRFFIIFSSQTFSKLWAM